ncbi:hypothetical protein ElyMa_001713500 [Elysia marginata]|uniref:Uncharacterized protein n=1 Tax=Elysia marginata TaxID=1093978 RepID=A0AAV4JU45_9GAST|nr:hypothetical protein ElyMa_001713500 [Elysia marginata]
MLLFLLPQKIGVRDKRAKVLEALPSQYQPKIPNGVGGVDDEASDEDNDVEYDLCGNRIHRGGPSRTTSIPPACDAVTHRAEVYSHYEKGSYNGNRDIRYRPADTEDEESAQADSERRPLLGSLNSQANDIGIIS